MLIINQIIIVRGNDGVRTVTQMVCGLAQILIEAKLVKKIEKANGDQRR